MAQVMSKAAQEAKDVADRITGTAKAEKSSRALWAFVDDIDRARKGIFEALERGDLRSKNAVVLRRIVPRAEKIVSAYFKGQDAGQKQWEKMVRKALDGTCPRCGVANPRTAADKLFFLRRKPKENEKVTFNLWECESCSFSFVYETR